MSFIKKVAYLFLITIAIGGGINFVSAQTKDTKLDIQILDVQPEVYVKNIQLDKNIYQSGDTVKGKFTLWNDSNFPVSDLYYEVALVGGYQENTLAKDYYDSIKLGPLYFQAKESRVIDFTYTIPKTVAGKGLGIQIGALLGTGFRMGWSDAYIEVQGQTGYLLLEEADVVIGEEKFGLQIGPTLHEGEVATLSFTLKNMTNSAISLDPKIEIYNRANPEVILLQEKIGLAAIPVKSSKTFNYNLPTFSAKAGVYVGKVDFVDESGLKRSADLEFRYIIPGEILTIKGLTVDAPLVDKGDKINVALDYSGPTFDIRDTTDVKNSEFDLEVRLYSEKNKLVAEYKNKVDFNQGNRTVFPVIALNSAKEIRSEVLAKSGEKVVATYRSTIPLAGEEKTEIINSPAFLVTILALLVLLLISLIKKNKKIAIVILAVILVGSLFAYLAEAFTSTNSGRSGVGDSPTIPSVSISSPSGSYTVGQTFHLTGSASAANCSNQYLRMLYYYKLNPNDSWTNPASSILNDGRSGSNTNTTRTGQFSIGPFVASGPAGVKKIYFRIEAYAYWGRTKWDESSFREGYQEYTVVPPAATCSDGIQNQNETGVDCGGVCPSCGGGTSSCTSAIPTGSTQCPGTLTNTSTPWTYIASCPTAPGYCQYTNTVGGGTDGGGGGGSGGSGGGADTWDDADGDGSGATGGPLDCTKVSMTMPTSSPVNINVLTTWTATSTALGFATSSKTWTFNGTGTTTATSSTMDKAFNTVGLKTVSVTAGGNTCTATTTVVSSGGSNREI